MKKQKFKEKGITLIALVITIIVLLILAGVTLSILLQTGIIENSQKAVNLYQSKVEDEVKQIDDLNIQMQTQFGILDNTEGEKNQTITGEAPKYNNPIIPVGFKTSNEGASWKSSDGKTVDGWNSGLVIEDKDGNQFVWVPAYIEDTANEENNKEFVDNNVTKYEKFFITIPNDYYIVESSNDVSDDKPSEVTDEEKQIKDYGGFYIGRYEAGIPKDSTAWKPTPTPNDTQEAMQTARNIKGTPVSKKNQVPWNNIDYIKSKENAESMYTGKSVKSGLLTGRMWDTTLQWISKTNDIKEDSTSWGNYRTSTIPGVTSYSLYADWRMGVEWINETATKPGRNENIYETEYIWLLKTGNTEYTKRNNIYDLAGNIWEWTYEKKKRDENSFNYIHRGGGYNDTR